MLLLTLSTLTLLAWLYLTFLHGRFWQPLVDFSAEPPKAWPSVTIIVPARNEAESLPRSLPSWLKQDYPGEWRVVLVDDHSTDGTGALAQDIATKSGKSDKLQILNAPDLPKGWSGKVAAQHHCVSQSSSDYILFTDADIEHPPHSLKRLMARSLKDQLDLNSLMVRLNCQSFAEKLLIPAFVFFFALLYPFRRANDPTSRVAAAAGGVMLVNRAKLEGIGGMARIKNALIDDCALARAIKDNKGRIRLTLARDVLSLRPYPTIGDVWDMIARTAFTQLHYSPLLLAGSVLGLALLFFVPVVVPLVGTPAAALTSLTAWLVMAGIYWPLVAFYRLPVWWALLLPAAALIYILATLDSARRYWQGKGGQWKGRSQAT